MTGVTARIRKDIREVLLAAAFFSAGFCMIVLAERLFTGTGAESASFVRALIGGLIVAKLLLIVDLLPFAHVFPHRPLIHNILWKSSLYVAASVVFQYVDPFIRHFFKSTGAFAAHSHALQELTRSRTWAVEIWLAMLLVVFVTMKELSRVVGKDEMKRIFFGSAGKPARETRSRPAA